MSRVTEHGHGIRGRPADGASDDDDTGYWIECPFCGEEYDAADLQQLIYHDMTPGHELNQLVAEMDAAYSAPRVT